ncbi:MAG: hypothetical protein JNK11_17550 [Alphaproteobacteria bacterium]|nr:hypothetical protein [Alphaproteobacteria bacterium]
MAEQKLSGILGDDERVAPGGLFVDPAAQLTDEALLDLYATLSEDDLIHQLKETARAARTAADEYARKAERLDTLAKRLEAQHQAEESRIAEARGQRSIVDKDVIDIPPRAPAGSAPARSAAPPAAGASAAGGASASQGTEAAAPKGPPKPSERRW